jgi:hypothetical protein
MTIVSIAARQRIANLRRISHLICSSVSSFIEVVSRGVSLSRDFEPTAVPEPRANTKSLDRMVLASLQLLAPGSAS